MGERFVSENVIKGPVVPETTTGEPRKKSERNWLLNKYTALAAGIITVLGVKLGFDASQKVELQEQTMSDLKDLEEDVPDDAEAARDVIKDVVQENADDIVNARRIAEARAEQMIGRDAVDASVGEEDKNEEEVPKYFTSADDTENERYWSLEKCVKEWGQITNVEIEVDNDQTTKTCYNFKNGQRLCKTVDKTLSENPPVTKEKLSKIGEYFEAKCPAAKVIEMDGDGRRFFLEPGGEVTVGEDGSFSLSGRSFYQGGNNLTLDGLVELAILNTEIEQLTNDSKGNVEVNESGVSTETKEEFDARAEKFMKNLEALKAGYNSSHGE